MRVTIAHVVDAFDLLYTNIHDRTFRKTLNLDHWSERELLPLVRTFLLGHFQVCAPEVKVRLRGRSRVSDTWTSRSGTSQ